VKSTWRGAIVAIALATSACHATSGASDGGARRTDTARTRSSSTGGTTKASGECTFDGKNLLALIECVRGSRPVQLASGVRPAPSSNVAADNPYPYTVQEYLNYIIADVDKVWTKWFTDNGLKEPYVGIKLINPGDQPFVSKCTNVNTVVHDHPNAFYCPADSLRSGGVNYQGVVILPVTTFQKMWNGNILDKQSKLTGDFGAAVVTAHEMGHHVQDEIMLQVNATRTTPIGPPAGKNGELVADCFAGVWMASAYHSGLLEPGDFEEGVAALEAIGDHTGSHGSSAERRAALLTGYNGITGQTEPGDPMACIRTYWL